MNWLFPDEGLDVARSVLIVVAGVSFGVWWSDVWFKRRVRRVAEQLGAPEDGERALETMRIDSLAVRIGRWAWAGSIAAYLVLSAFYAAR